MNPQVHMYLPYNCTYTCAGYAITPTQRESSETFTDKILVGFENSCQARAEFSPISILSRAAVPVANALCAGAMALLVRVRACDLSSELCRSFQT